MLDYDRLLDDIRWEMFCLARFLELPVEIRTPWCVAVNSEGVYHRARMAHGAMFTDELSDIVRRAIYNVTHVRKHYNIGTDVLDSYRSLNSFK